MSAKLKALVAKLAEVCWDGGTLDGGELQTMLEEAGVLTGVAKQYGVAFQTISAISLGKGRYGTAE